MAAISGSIQAAVAGGSLVGDDPVDDSTDTGGKGIVCTEMYRQTQLEDWAKAMKIWYVYQKKYLSPLHEKGYHWLFKPYVTGMKKSTTLTGLGAYLAKKRTEPVSYTHLTLPTTLQV